jgi:predicted nucleic acid-binding protein
MIYLLDVNALVALGFINHEFHDRIADWIQSHDSPNLASLHLASCSITELGFVRVLAQAPAYGFTVAQARALLLRLRQARNSRFTFIPDGHDVSHLPSWVRAPKQITDGHLSKLASANGAVLATLDENIPGSYLIPK